MVRKSKASAKRKIPNLKRVGLMKETTTGPALVAECFRPAKLSRDEVRELCEEYFDHKLKLGKFEWRVVGVDFGFGECAAHSSCTMTIGKSDMLCSEALKSRMGEIIRLVGQDTLDVRRAAEAGEAGRFLEGRITGASIMVPAV
jgi:hypothetical protein